MTRFTVTWHPEMQGLLATIWISHPDQQAITTAADTIDAELAKDPYKKGEEVSEGLRGLTVAPLRVLYVVHELDRRVEVVSVKLVSPLPPVTQRNGPPKPPI